MEGFQERPGSQPSPRVEVALGRGGFAVRGCLNDEGPDRGERLPPMEENLVESPTCLTFLRSLRYTAHDSVLLILSGTEIDQPRGRGLVTPSPSLSVRMTDR